ncbi:CGNR zinc finger domain-containing protein [Micromonospora sp. NPDC049230]|uniref:CGNR zinc finger domain-containing protein n=1 Tax=Micromonospora sp. NPDC049230 TaxID=3155502 RepID=UPI00340BE454
MRRPLEHEPFALDLLNTRWVDQGREFDALDDHAWAASWLLSHGFRGWSTEAGAALRETRDALRAIVETPGEGAEVALNLILARGRVRFALRAGVPTRIVEVADEWLPAWEAADNYLDLVGRGPRRLRRCSGAGCALYFYDISRNGGRRWCSMETCGNRSKVSRHYRRVRAG